MPPAEAVPVEEDEHAAVPEATTRAASEAEASRNAVDLFMAPNPSVLRKKR